MTRKNILSAYGTFRFHTLFAAPVFFEKLEGHTRVAMHTVKIVDTQSPTPSTHITGRTVVDITLWLIIK